jgi:hypothetical protein
LPSTSSASAARRARHVPLQADKLETFIANRSAKLDAMNQARPDLGEQVDAALIARRAELNPAGKPDAARGGQFTDDDIPDGF